MQVFYTPEVTGDFVVLDANESGHAVKVFRMVKGDRIKVTDGNGNLYECRITKADTFACHAEIESIVKDFEKRNYRLSIGISPVKNRERFEWFVEKSVEIGIDEITPVICWNTEKTGIKMERLNSIIISAMKQSIKAFKPVLNEPVSFAAFIKSGWNGIRMIAHCNSKFEKAGISRICQKSMNSVILIGPEGDFTENEIQSAEDNGFISVGLGNSRLRTETAGIVACHTIYMINQQDKV